MDFLFLSSVQFNFTISERKRLINQRKNRKYFFLIVIYKILLLIKSKNNITLFVFVIQQVKDKGKLKEQKKSVRNTGELIF